jgi:hypothetical protein
MIWGWARAVYFVFFENQVLQSIPHEKIDPYHFADGFQYNFELLRIEQTF